MNKDLQRELRRHGVTFWGRKCVITPRLVDRVWGDGLKPIYFTPLNTRPNYYVVRLDSQCDMDADEFYHGILEEIYEAIEEQFGTASEEWTSDKNGRAYTRRNPFPALDDDCGSCWGEL